MTNHIAFYQFCSAVRRKGALALCLALCLLGLALSASAQKPRFITFDAPGAGTIPNPTWGMGTFAFGINDLGEIGGWYVDDNEVHHGYLRTPNGRIATFEYSGAGTGFCQGTLSWEMNSWGVTAGHYIDSENVFHGFLRALDGRITPFSVEGAGTVPGECGGQGTYVAGINQAGVIAGEYADSNWNDHGYVRTPDGRITVFDPKGSVSTGENNGTPINQFGVITGYYADANWVWHGFLRAPDGRITTFDAPGAGTAAGEGTFPTSINDNGTIAGFLQDNNELTHGFVLYPDGKFRTFDVPGGGTVVGSWQGTYPIWINSAGAIAGYIIDSNGVSHGFLRTPDGRITTIDVPGAGTAAGQGTTAYSINDLGAITGFYSDASGITHGFLRTP
jgi:hypothetical protein